MRCFDLIAEEGTINNATFPAAVSRGPIGPAWLTGNLIAECLAQMLDQHIELGKNVQASCCGTWDTAVIAGLDERADQAVPFLNIMMEPMAGGYGARPVADGMDTGGLFCIPMGRIPDTEMTEFLYPLLTLWRREEPDSGGPGRMRGGVSASVAVTPYGSSLPMGLVFASAGKAVAQNGGLAGGLPGNTGLEILARDAGVAEMLAGGQIPGSLDDLAGTRDIGACYAESYLAPGEVLYMHWQGGGGYGDPLRREVASVGRDVINGKVSADGARVNYGVVVTDGQVDIDATTELREALLAERRSRSDVPQVQEATVNLTGGRRIDDNLTEVHIGDARVIACAHCGRLLGDSKTGRLDLARYEGPSSDAGPQVTSDPAEYVDTAVVFRQQCCPGCWTAVYSGIVPADHPDHVSDLARLLPAVAE